LLNETTPFQYAKRRLSTNARPSWNLLDFRAVRRPVVEILS